MLWTPPGPCFQGIISNFSGQPAFNVGTSHTSGVNNTKAASYTEIFNGSAVTHDVYAVEILFGGVAKSGDNSQTFVDLGLDAANGGSYTAFINNLQASNASNWDGGDAAACSLGGVGYYFPVFIKAGTQIGVRAQTNDNAAVTVLTLMKLFCQPKYPHLARAGSYVDTFGANTGTTVGVSVTSGQGSDGAWTDISGGDTTKDYWHWQIGWGITGTAFSSTILFNDLAIGDGSNKQIIVLQEHCCAGDNEQITRRPHPNMGYCETPAGVRPYARSRTSSAGATVSNVCVYAVGG